MRFLTLSTKGGFVSPTQEGVNEKRKTTKVGLIPELIRCVGDHHQK